MANVIHWRHYSGAADANGMLWVDVGNAGESVLSFGGYAAPLVTANDTSTDTFGLDSHGMTPLVASRPSYDSGTDTDYVVLGFAAPPGVFLRCHLWWTEV
jgi:hypothetical protein